MQGQIDRRPGMRRVLLGFAGAAALAVMAAPAIAGEAHFVVHDEVVAPDPGPTGVNLGPVANGERMIRRDLGGFEPLVFRTWFLATADAADRVLARERDISLYDSWRSGALDGAEIDILRIENGRFRVVRTDRVAEGGHQVSGWIRALRDNRVIPADRTEFTFAWDPWNRPDADYFFTVRAADPSGRLSNAAEALTVRSPERIPREDAPDDDLTSLDLHGETGAGPPAPRNFRLVSQQGARVTFAWDAVPGAAGYVVERSDEPPERHRGYYLALAGGAAKEPVRRGDLVAIRKRFTELSPAKYHSNRVWGANGRFLRHRLIDLPPDGEEARRWRLAPHAPDTPVEDPGETYLEAMLAPGAEMRIGTATHSGTGQQYYDVIEPGYRYRIEAWMKADRPATASFRMTGAHSRAILPLSFRVGTEWERHVAEFSVLQRDDGRRPQRTELILRGPGTISVDNFRMYRADTPYLALPPEDRQRLRDAGVRSLRTHGLIKTGMKTYDLKQLLQPPGLAHNHTLPGDLEIAASVGAGIWLQIEPHLTAAEWHGLVEFLAAPFDPDADDPKDKPWAALRHEQGRTAPWTEAFDEIKLELGNETWNGTFFPWMFQAMTDAATGERYSRGAVYGIYQDHVAGFLRSSPYWTPAVDEQVTIAIGGWEATPNYGADAARHARSAELVTTAPYIGGWEAGAEIPEETPEGFFGVLTHMLQTSRPRAERHTAKIREIAQSQGRELALGVYESGPGYRLRARGGARLSPEEVARQERVMKSLAAGTATLDAFLARAELGYRTDSFFAYKPGPYWTTHAPEHQGGYLYPAWMLLAVYNRHATGALLRVETLAAPRADLPESRRRQAVSGAPLADAYATRQGDRLAVVLVSRRVPGHPDPADDGVTQVTLDLPIAGAERIRRFTTTGRHDDHNVEAERIRLLEDEIPAGSLRPLGSGVRLHFGALQPGHVQFVVLDGVRQRP